MSNGFSLSSIFPPLIGGALGALGSGGQTQTTNQSAQVPAYLQPFIQQSLGIGGGALGNLQNFLNPGGQPATAQDLIAPFSPQQIQGINMGTQQALDPNGPFAAATNQLQRTVEGDFFNSPEYQASVDALFNRQSPGVLSSFIGAGRGTGGLAQNAIAQTALDANALRFGEERNRQLVAAGLIPNVAPAASNQLLNLGAIRQQQAQSELTAPIEAQIGLLSSSLGGLPKVQGLIGQSQQQQLPGNRLLGGLGGAIAGQSIFDSLTGNAGNAANAVGAAAGALGALGPGAAGAAGAGTALGGAQTAIGLSPGAIPGSFGAGLAAFPGAFSGPAGSSVLAPGAATIGPGSTFTSASGATAGAPGFLGPAAALGIGALGVFGALSSSKNRAANAAAVQNYKNSISQQPTTTAGGYTGKVFNTGQMNLVGNPNSNFAVDPNTGTLFRTADMAKSGLGGFQKVSFSVETTKTAKSGDSAGDVRTVAPFVSSNNPLVTNEASIINAGRDFGKLPAATLREYRAARAQIDPSVIGKPLPGLKTYTGRQGVSFQVDPQGYRIDPRTFERTNQRIVGNTVTLNGVPVAAVGAGNRIVKL